MSKQLRQYLRRSLCGMLSAAMIATSLIVPNMTVYAAPQDEAGIVTENEEDKLVEEITGENETGDESQGSGLEESGEGSVGDKDNVDDEDGSSEIGGNAGEDDKGNPDGDSEENPGGDLTDDEKAAVVELKEVPEAVMVAANEEEQVINPVAATGDYGKLLNGDFQLGTGEDNWIDPTSWTISNDYKCVKGTDNNETYHVGWWAESDIPSISLSQTIENIKPGIYTLSMRTYSNYTEADNITVKIRKIIEGEDEAEAAYFLNKKLEEAPNWEWKSQTVDDGINISAQDGEQVNVEFSISGSLGSGRGFKVDDIKLELADEAAGSLQNGDFDSVTTNDKNEWTGSTGWTLDGLWPKEDAAWANNKSVFLYCNNDWSDSATTYAKQEIKNLEPGVYKISVEAGGTYEEDTFALTVTDSSNKELESESLGAGTGYGKWETYATDTFEVTDSNNSSITVMISGTLARGKEILLDNVTMTKVTYTLEQLQELHKMADSKEESDYKADSFAALTNAKNAAKTVIDKGSSATSKEIIDAYIKLKTAMDELVPLSSTVDFYYYADDKGDAIGLYLWGENISSKADSTSWHIKAAGDTHKLEKVTGYAGWYKIPITFKDGGADSGFRICTAADTGTENGEYKCDASNNKEAYAALASGQNKTGAVKNGKAYIGTYETTHNITDENGNITKTRKSVADKASMIMRNITLNIYSEDVVPVLHLDNQSELAKLSVIDEVTGEISDIKPSGTDSYGNPYYEMQRQESFWYTLSFSAPDTISRDGFDGLEKFCGLAEKTEDGCSWLKSLVNKQTSNAWEADLTPAFDGKIWCKYEHGSKDESSKLTFYADRDEADAVTLDQLDKLLKSEKVEEISATGEKGYTEVSWKAFNEAKKLAEDVVNDHSGQNGDVKDESIKKAYVELKYAVQNMEVKITLATLKALLESDAVKEITKKGQEAYTEESWTAFDKAKSDAETVVKNNSTQADSYVSEDISKAYEALQDAVKNVSAVNDTITLYFYSKALNDYTDSETETYHLYMSTWNKEKIASSKEEVALAQATWDYTAYLFDEVTDEAVNMGYKNWYSIPVKRIKAGDGADGDGFLIQIGKAVVADGKTTHTALESDVGLIKLSYWAYPDIYKEIATMEKGGSIAIKNGKAFGSIQEAEAGTNITKKLQDLVNRAKLLKEADYKKGWDAFTKALTAAEKVLQAAAEAEEDEAKEAPTEEQIDEAYDDLLAAMNALVPASAQQAEINVKKVALTDDFITGADISSYYALKESGVVFKDEKGNPLSDQGFFDYLYEGGMNWARIRIWNDPYNSSGNGYGGGNNDLEKAKVIGKWASDAGMKVLIDFHYSDFWADPSKQKAPKAWAGYSVEQKEDAVYKFTLESLRELKSAGVNVGMVQVGNETNNGIAGVTGWANMSKIFKAGSKAVREFDKDCLVAVHFTDPQNGYGAIADQLKAYEVDYDVFASSYYPFGHGDAANLRDVLEYVAKTYDKKVMAAETSWPTTLVDGDGYGTTTPPTVPEKYKDQDYGVSVQGQADEMYDLIKAVNEINDEHPGSSLGVFYWEPAWISPYYIKDDEGNDIDSLYDQNFALWEEYGSGWASSYATEYDPDDAGVWFGGSAMDNSSWFDFDGTALPTAKIYSLIRTGAEAELKIASVDSNPVKKVDLGEEIDWAKVTVTAKYNNGTTAELAAVWEETETELVNTYKAGEYIVHGIVSAEGKNYKITLTVQVLRDPTYNILVNPDFENKSKAPWNEDIRVGDAGENDVVRVTDEDPHGGELGLHFWSKIGLDFTVSQTVTPEAGTYAFGSYIQGGGADREDVQYAFAKVTDKDGKQKSYLKTAFALNGWRNWANPEITGITVEAGDILEVGLIMKSTKDGAWGTMDDFYLYGTHTVSIAEGIVNGTVATNIVKANGGEKIIVTVTPDGGYYPAKLTLSGASITDKTLTSSNGSVAYVPAAGETPNQAVLTYTEKKAEEKSETFTMPTGNVTISAEFVSVFEAGAEKIDLNVKENGKYLVEVNAEESKYPAGETPIADQFYTGKDVKPAVQLSYKGYQLTSADYTVKYENNKNKTSTDSKAKIILTAKGEKFTGTREISFEIKEDTRNDFNAKKLKVVFEASDKNGRTDKAAQAVYYLGTEKEIEPKISLYNAADGITDTTKAIDPSMYEVYYQNNKKVGKATLVVLPSEEAMSKPDGYKEGSITTTFTIAKCPINQQDVTVTMSDKPSYYTGKKVEPAATVTYTYKDQNGNDKSVTLVKGRDYTVTYTNNLNASVYEVVTKDAAGNEQKSYENINSKKVPTVKITGKGNFAGVRTTYDLKDGSKAGTEKITFAIYPRSITNTTITVADLAENKKAQAPKITVKDGTKTVAASQYVIEKIVKTHDAENKSLPQAEVIYSRADNQGTAKVTAAGTYAITIAGKAKSNYEAEKNVDNAGINDKLTFRVADKDQLIANAKITIRGKFYYTGDQVTLSTSGDNPNLTVKAGTGTNAETLTGFAKRDEAVQGGVEKDGYYVTYSNNVSAGKAVITVNGTGKYVGTKTATFKIEKRALAKQVSDSEKDKKGEIQTPKLSVKVAKEKLDGVWVEDAANAADDAKGALINLDDSKSGSLEVPYTGYTINPDFKFSSANYYAGLEEGKQNIREMATGDYTVSYKVGKWENGKAPVTVTVKGKGNYSGSVKFDNLFTLAERDFSKLSIEVASATYNGKALKPAVTFYNEEGKVVNLKLGTAYTVTYKNNKEANQKSDKQPTVTVKQKGKGWGSTNVSITKTFTIDQAEITKADIGDVKFQTFLGKALKPKVTVKVNGRKLREGKDYTLAYSKNVKRGGTATVTITGKGNYFTRKPIVKTFVIK